MKIFDLNKKFWQWALLMLLAFNWGSSFILMKRGLEVYSHTLVAAIRIAVTFIVLIPFALKHFAKVKRHYWKYLIATGVLGNGIPAFLFTLAQTKISSSVSGMLNSLTPIFALIVGLLFFKQRTKTSQVFGVITGLVGAISLIATNGVNTNNENLTFSFYIVLATICYALSVNIIKSYLKDISSAAITALAFLSIGPIAICYLFITDFINITTHHPNALNALTYISLLAVFGTAMSVLLFNMLIKKTTTLFASSVTYLIPVFAIMWGILDGEVLSWLQLISIGVILFGIYFINKK